MSEILIGGDAPTASNNHGKSAWDLADLGVLDSPALGRRVRSRTHAIRPQGLIALLGADLLALSLALVIGPTVAALVRGRAVQWNLSWLVYLPIFVAAIGFYGLYRRGHRRLVGSSFPDISELVHSLLVAGVVSVLSSDLLARAAGFPRMTAGDAAASASLALIAVTQCRAAARWLLARRAQGAESRVLIVGSGMVASRVMARLTSVRGVTLLGWVDDSLTPVQGADMGGLSRLGELNELVRVVDEWDVDHVVIAFSPVAGSTLASVVRDLSARTRISIVPRLFDLLSVRSHVDDIKGLPVVDVAPPSLGLTDRFAKRVMDILLSATALILLSPLLLAILVAIKLTSPGPVLYAQERVGRNRRVFRIYKFRTMRVDADRFRIGLSNSADGPLFKAHRDPRVTRVGRLLRTTSLDELPQLINVLKGDMSLIGPRPFIPPESNQIQGWAGRRFDVRPGMTGLWQISGRSDLPFDELCRLDYSYVASWSLWWDLHILWHTPGSVMRRDGAY